MSNSDISTNRNISDFHNIHKGGVCLLVGNGKNLALTPPETFSFPTFGMNTIHLYEGWKPTYYTTVDSRVMIEFGAAVYERFIDIPKFIPTPNLDKWQGENFYRFYHRPGVLWPDSQAKLWPSGLLTEQGITYGNVMHIAMQLAYFMGFTTLLVIGMEHKEHKAQDHFWGCDHRMGANIDIAEWLHGYKVLANGMIEHGVRILNISVDTGVGEDVLIRDDWRNWI